MRPFVFFNGNGGAGVSLLLIGTCWTLLAAEANAPYPAETWPSRTPEQVGLSVAKLDDLRDLVGGRGCVVRHGYMVYAWGDQARSGDVASAMKPVLSTLLFLAIQEGKLKSADDPVSDFEPRLKEINNGKDATITWRHLASQTSGYGLTELPGQAYSYNDYAIALYYDTLTQKVFQTNGTALLKRYLAEPLQFEDDCTFEAFGPSNRPGRLAVSVRDFARFGLLYLRNGRWRDRQLVQPELIRTAINSPIPADLPLTLGQDAEMLPRQRSLGGKKNITPIGPGFYSFNWWLNRTNQLGQRLYVDAPPDTYIAGGHGGKRMLWIIPSLDLLVSWNDSPIDDHDRSPGNADTRINQAARLIREAANGSPTESRPGSRTRHGIQGAGAEDAAAAGAPAVEKHNVVWDSPSESSFGSMPLGNGDIGLNVWVEKNGHLLFYIAKVDALDSGQVGRKLGRIRLRMDPPLPLDRFRQTLSLRDASVLVEAGDVQLRVWVDAHQPIIRVEGESRTPRTAFVTLESLRPLANATDRLPGAGTVGVLFNDKEDRLAWCYRNQWSDWWAENFRNQNTPAMVAQTKDPLLHRTSGCLLQGKGFVRVISPFGELQTTLRLAEPSTVFDYSVKVLSTQPENLQAWLSEAIQPVRSHWDAHCAYWKSFWDRSYIHITSGGQGKFNLDQCRFTQFPQGSKAYEGHKEIDAAQNVWQISQRYALERFCEACASRGAVPPNANGSLFTMDMPAGVMGGYNRVSESPISPDFRYWEDCCWFMWQNLRFPYWAMATRGDYDTLRPGMQFVRDGLEICEDRCRKIFGHEGAFIFEASAWLNVGRFNPPGPPHLRHHFLATVETPAIMCDYYEHTRDRAFFDNILLPCADELLEFYELHYPKRDANGIMQMEGVGAAETYQGVTNPATEIGGIKYVLTKMLSFEIDEARRRHWTELLKSMPGVPLRKIRGLDLLAVGEKYHPGGMAGAGDSGEHPELYTIYPFRQVWLGRPQLLNVARQSFHLRIVSLDGSRDTRSMETGGWQMTPVQAAYLGLPREAARLTSINFNDQFIFYCDNFNPDAPYPNRPRARFPAFWETKTDGTPDCDHGAASANALQSMLLQSDGRRIFLLPAWPEDWDVTFKLWAANNTAVECTFRDGRVQSLKVTPESRRGDIVDMTTPAQRIRTLVEVALADHNYLFGLPAMLDAQPIPGKVTGPWIEQYGHTIQGCKAGPWSNSLFCDKVVYVHVLDWPQEGVRLPGIPRKLVSAKSITGNIEVKQLEGEWLLTGTPDALDTIVRLEFDASVEEIAMGLPSVGSLTLGRQRSMQSDTAGRLVATVDLGGQKTVRRFEFTVDNPGYLRGQSRPYEFQVKQADGSWRTAYEGEVFGSICARSIAPVAATAVRVVVQAPGIRQLDVYEK